MSAPVDVLAVMDGTRAHLNSITCHPSYVERMDEARAAIAELIEAAKESTAFIGYDGTGAEQVRARVYAALACVGGAA